MLKRQEPFGFAAAAPDVLRAALARERAMSGRLGKLGLGLAAALVALTAGIGAINAAEEMTADKILNALKPRGLTRSLSGPAPTAKAMSQEDQRFINSLRTKRTRSLSAGERQKVATLTKEKPSVDLTINFDYNSANISSKAMPLVNELGKALADPSVKGGVFLVAGHTDAKGGDDYNQKLSERRAEAIKRFLSEKYNIPAENLVTVGYGETQLKNTADPNADENRRVQVVNMESTQQAAR
jgi:outer membrane protein OmpA-like peptidoglycan-associated protein